VLLLGLSPAFSALRLSGTGAGRARANLSPMSQPPPAEHVRRPAIKLASIMKPINENSGTQPKATRPKSLQQEKQPAQVEQARNGAGELLVKTLAVPLSLVRATRNATVNEGISPEEDMAAAAETAADVVRVGAAAAISWNFVLALGKAAATVAAAATVGPAFKLIGAAGALSIVSDNATAAVGGAQNYERKIWVNGTHYMLEGSAEALRALAASADAIAVMAATSAELDEDRAVGDGFLPELEEEKSLGGLLPERWRHQPVQDADILRERLAEEGTVASSTTLQDKYRARAADAEPSVVWGVAPMAVPLQDEYRSQASTPPATPSPEQASRGSPSIAAPGATPVAQPSSARRAVRDAVHPPPAMRKALFTQKAAMMRALIGYVGTATFGSLVLGSGYAAVAGPSAALLAARRVAPKIVASSAALLVSAALCWRGWPAFRSVSRARAKSLSSA
jgi:hypothetical protein